MPPFDPRDPRLDPRAVPPPGTLPDDLPVSDNPNDAPTHGSLAQSDPFAFPGAEFPQFDNGAFEDTVRASFGVQPASVPTPGLETAPPPGDEEALHAGPTPAEEEQLRKRAVAALYGADCPILKDTPGDDDWTRWATSLWERHRAAMQPMIRNAARNRLFRQGKQWIAWRGEGWREPPAPKDEARLVHNMVRPALALRQQIVSEQRPGFRVTPMQQTPTAQKSAEAQQRALEVQYDQQRMERVIREAAYWAGTDGVSFLHLYWDDERGPEDEIQGGQSGRTLGDLTTCVYRIEQVRVSANATSTEKPAYWVLRSVLSLAEAVARYGPTVARTRLADGDAGLGAVMDGLGIAGASTGGATERRDVPPTQLLTDQDTVDQYTVYCEPSGALSHGLMLIVCGDAVIHVGDLPWGIVPLVRFTDGSEDPAFYPMPLLDDWVDHQRRVNALLSKNIENIRVNAHGRLLTRPGAIKGETLVGGVLSLIEVQQGVSMQEAVQPIPPFSVGADVKEQLAFEIHAFEQKSGWNDATRGSFDGGESGRSILAQRETVERIFTPPVAAAADAMTRWAEVAIHGMRWGYDLPRWIGATGGDRPDLGMSVSSDDFAGVGTVHIDPETMMPLPRSMRLFLLDQMLGKGVMTPDEYRQRLPFAYTGSLSSPKTHKEARARRITLAIQQGTPVPDPRWTDDEAIVQSVLEEEILDVDKPDDPDWSNKVALATQVWTHYAQQAAMKQGGMPQGMPSGGPPGPPDAAKQGLTMPPNAQPFPGTNPGVASAPAAALAAESDEDRARAMDGLLGR